MSGLPAIDHQARARRETAQWRSKKNSRCGNFFHGAESLLRNFFFEHTFDARAIFTKFQVPGPSWKKNISRNDQVHANSLARQMTRRLFHKMGEARLGCAI